MKLIGTGVICFGGVIHGLNEKGQPICETKCLHYRLYNDRWFGFDYDGYQTILELCNEITCKKCRKTPFDNCDYKMEEIVGHQEVRSMGGEVISIPLLEGYSSSSIIDRNKA